MASVLPNAFQCTLSNIYNSVLTSKVNEQKLVPSDGT